MSDVTVEIGAAAAAAVAEPKKYPLLIDLVRRIVREKPLGVVGGVISLILILTAVLANWLAPYGFNEIILADRLAGPSPAHILGADNLGRDLLSRLIYGSRISITVGLGGSLLGTLVAIIIGIFSGYLGGKFDIITQRFVDAIMCFPALILMLSIMAIVGPGLTQITLVLGISHGIRSSRVIRSAVIGIKENVYVEAARAIGAQNMRILTRHILPNIMAPTIITFSVAIGALILQESTLSFLGYGVPPPMPSWGGMLSGPGRQYMLQAPWMMLWPGLALALVVYGMNMLGDAVRDLLDPRLRGGLGRYSGVKRKMPKQKDQA